MRRGDGFGNCPRLCAHLRETSNMKTAKIIHVDFKKGTKTHTWCREKQIKTLKGLNNKFRSALDDIYELAYDDNEFLQSCTRVLSNISNNLEHRLTEAAKEDS